MPDKGSLYHFLPTEVAPPPQVWSCIEDSLNETKSKILLCKLSDWEQTPPTQVWSKIDTYLTQAPAYFEFTVAEEMRRREINPPIKVWNNIQKALDGFVIKTISPAKRVARSLWFAAAAAASIGVIFLVTPLLKGRKDARVMSSNITAIVDTVLTDTNMVTKAGKNSTDVIITFPEATTAFIKAVGPNGNTVKVSPKLSQLVEFLHDLNGENTSDNKKPESAKEQMWKQKLAQWEAVISPLAGSAATINFADPIELIRFLEKNH